MEAQEKINNLENEITQLKVQILAGTRTVKYTSGAIAVIVFIFFGLTYASLESVISIAVQKYIQSEAVKSATKKAEEAAASSIERSQEASQTISSAVNEVQTAKESALKDIPNIVMAINNTIYKIDGFADEAEKRVKIIDGKIETIDKIIPNLESLSTSGFRKDGEIIDAPWGTVEDWSLIVSPRFFGSVDSKEMLYGKYNARAINLKQWQVEAISFHRFGVKARRYDGEVNYLVEP